MFDKFGRYINCEKRRGNMTTYYADGFLTVLAPKWMPMDTIMEIIEASYVG